jgi:hypothetical protein
VTHRFSARSVLLPTSMMMTSWPRSVRTSSIHLEVCWKELRSAEQVIMEIRIVKMEIRIVIMEIRIVILEIRIWQILEIGKKDTEQVGYSREIGQTAKVHEFITHISIHS